MLAFRMLPVVTLLAAVSTAAMAADPAPAPTSETACAGGYASTFRIGGAVSNPKTYTLADLQKMTPSKVTVSWYSGKAGFVTESYIGVPLIDLINDAEVIVDPNQKNDILRQFLLVTASDCYQVTVALGEILPTFNGELAIVAFADGDGVPLGPDEGMARLIIPDSKAGGRNVSNVSRLYVRSPGPAPQSGK